MPFEGKPLRNNAEKSVLLNEFLVELLTPELGMVWDMFAGSGSMETACIKTKRLYVGCDPDADLHLWSTQRLGKMWAAAERSEFTNMNAGISRSLAEQVKNDKET